MITPHIPPELEELKQLFDSIDAEAIQRYCDEHRSEDFQLDFKTANGNNLDHRDDQRSYSKALSGFANTSGGIIVWGVETGEGTDEEPDYAVRTAPFDDVNAFVAALNRRTSEAIYPRTVHVHSEAIPLQPGSKSGFAKTLVGPRELDPISAVFCNKYYYRRSGESFHRVEHDELRDMFGIRRPPILRIKMGELRARPDDKFTHIIVSMNFGLENVGRFSAVAPFVSFTIPPDCSFAVADSSPLSRGFFNPNENTFAVGANTDTVVHPGLAFVICNAKLLLPIVGQLDHTRIIGRHPALDVFRRATLAKVSEVLTTYGVSSYDMPIQTGQISVSAEEISALIELALDDAPPWVCVHP